MYTRQDQQQAARQTRQRTLTAFVPAAVVFALAVILFIIGRANRSEHMWKVTAALTVLAGAYATFFYGVYAKPMRDYRNHINYMLDGRLRETTGYLIDFSENLSERNGVDCHALMINVGEKDDREDDRLFYYDVKKLPLPVELGKKVTIVSNDRMVSDIREAE
ncbi:MAG: hypothetical protein E7323_11385 [Clostridiales bacterium]|nr:hypothetical protein [Clostridiales bacterium]